MVLEVTKPLLSMAKRTMGYDLIIERGGLPPTFDVHCEMMSLPMVMGLQLADLPGWLPYLSPGPGRLKCWRKRLAGLPRSDGWKPIYNGQNRAAAHLVGALGRPI